MDRHCGFQRRHEKDAGSVPVFQNVRKLFKMNIMKNNEVDFSSVKISKNGTFVKACVFLKEPNRL